MSLCLAVLIEILHAVNVITNEINNKYTVQKPKRLNLIWACLKVVGNEKLGGSGVWLLLEYGAGPW
jgi:hypothetical protein